MYSSVPNRRAVRNKRAGGKIHKKTLNVQDTIDVQGKIFWILNKRAGGNFLFKRLINVQDCQYNILPHPRVEV